MSENDTIFENYLGALDNLHDFKNCKKEKDNNVVIEFINKKIEDSYGKLENKEDNTKLETIKLLIESIDNKNIKKIIKGDHNSPSPFEKEFLENVFIPYHYVSNNITIDKMVNPSDSWVEEFKKKFELYDNLFFTCHDAQYGWSQLKKAFKGDNFDHYVLKTALDTWDSATSHVSSDYSSSNIVLHFHKY